MVQYLHSSHYFGKGIDDTSWVELNSWTWTHEFSSFKIQAIGVVVHYACPFFLYTLVFGFKSSVHYQYGYQYHISTLV